MIMVVINYRVSLSEAQDEQYNVLFDFSKD
jgi:hypothetical protein